MLLLSQPFRYRTNQQGKKQPNKALLEPETFGAQRKLCFVGVQMVWTRDNSKQQRVGGPG